MLFLGFCVWFFVVKAAFLSILKYFLAEFLFLLGISVDFLAQFLYLLVKSILNLILTLKSNILDFSYNFLGIRVVCRLYQTRGLSIQGFLVFLVYVQHLVKHLKSPLVLLLGHQAQRHIIEHGYLELKVSLLPLIPGNRLLEIHTAECPQILILRLLHLAILKHFIPNILLLLYPRAPLLKCGVF